MQIPLRDTDETRLLERLAVVLARYPQPPAPPAPARSAEYHREGWCQKHQTAMAQTTKNGAVWYSHRHEGQWCKGR